MMLRNLVVIITLLAIQCMPLPSKANDTTDALAPYVQVQVSKEEIMVGKPVEVTVTLMVPTIFRLQPEFPTYDGVNVVVKTAGADLRPVTKYIDGRKWMGASQRYYFYPMASGTFSFKAKQTSAIYTHPETSSSADVAFNIPSISFSAIVPKGAENLNPLIVADSLTLEQSWQGIAEPLSEGDAITRSVTARIEGSSVLFLPELIASSNSVLVNIYPQTADINDVEPSAVKTNKRMGGHRNDTVTYVAKYGGELTLPDISIRWFNVSTGKMETSSVKGRHLLINAPKPPVKPLLTKIQLVVITCSLLLFTVFVWCCQKYLVPMIKRTKHSVRHYWYNSESFAAGNVLTAIEKQNLNQVYKLSALWFERFSNEEQQSCDAFENALLAVGKAKFGVNSKEDWTVVETTFRMMRKQTKHKEPKPSRQALAQLNKF